jgi:hypothetical protein
LLIIEVAVGSLLKQPYVGIINCIDSWWLAPPKDEKTTAICQYRKI